MTLDGTSTLPKLAPHFAVYASAARGVYELEQNGADRDLEPVEELTALDLVLGLGLLRSVQVGVVLPIVLHEEGDDPLDPGGGVRPCGLGSLRTELKWSIRDFREGIVGVAAKAYATWPTGRDRDLVSPDGPGFGVTGVAETGFGDFVRLAVNVGYELVPGEPEIAGVRADDRLHVGAALRLAPILSDIDFLAPLGLFVEAAHSTLARDPWDREIESPLRLSFAIKYTGTVFGAAGVTWGINQGAGAPDILGFLAVGATLE